MARVPYVDSTDSAESERIERIYSEIRGLGRSVANLYRALANQPAALEAFLVMSRYVRNESSLPADFREMAILATAQGLEQPYEIAHHKPMALKAGVALEKITAILADQTEGFSPAEAAVVTYARHVARSRDVTDAAFEKLRAHFTNAEIVDIVLTVAWYHLCAAILGPLRIQLESQLQSGGPGSREGGLD